MLLRVCGRCGAEMEYQIFDLDFSAIRSQLKGDGSLLPEWAVTASNAQFCGWNLSIALRLPRR